jgi:outer membrane protein assembly factor BamE (lipoprotein component of BamABCDE complex)
MTKDGVRIALGYPAAHQTPSLNENTWVYWTNRFKSFKIEFDANGKVTKIQ